MDVTQTSQTTQTPPPAAIPAESTRPQISSDFETFLRMLTVQMQNQDPLNPIESSDYAVQLATFSGVEQQVQTNTLLRGLAAQLGAGGMAQMAGWVGKEARAVAPGAFDGTPITLAPSPAATADSAEVIVKDAAGNEVQRFAIPVAEAPVTWAGVTSDGYPLPEGLYSFEVASYAGDELLAQQPAAIYSTVTEVRVQDGKTVLILSGGAAVDATSVTALRDPSLI
jgi:flagellar basal-body rod modification protein FlgD